MSHSTNKLMCRVRARARESWSAVKGRIRRIPLPVKYAGAYLLMVVLISGFMWWRFNPARHIADAPLDQDFTQGHREEDPAASRSRPTETEISEPEEAEDENNTPAKPESDHLDSTSPRLSDRNRATFSPGRDNLCWPLEGAVVTEFGQVFTQFSLPGHISFGGNIEGIHITGEEGQPILASWDGVVEAIKPDNGLLANRVVLTHGQWKTVYINVAEEVEVGQTVAKGQQLGKLANQSVAAYGQPFLGFQVLDQDDNPCDPQEFLEQPQ